MKDSILGALGFAASAEGKLLGISDEFSRFYSSGYRCPSCNARLMSALGTMTVNFYTAGGEKLSLWQLGAMRADIAECPECHYRWKTKKSDAAAQPAKAAVNATVVETERVEEPIGSETRVIDNARSTVKLTRRFAVSKEWSKTYTVEYEKATTANAGVKLGISELSSFSAGFEQTLKDRFSIGQETKDTHTEEIEVEVPGSKRLTLVLNWKRIWQLGYLRYQDSQNHDAQNHEVRVPFRVVVGVTFDQSQIDDPS